MSSCKSCDFPSKRIDQIELTSIPGVSEELAKCLQAQRISTSKLFGYFLVDDLGFQKRYVKICGATGEESKTTLVAIKKWFKKNFDDCRPKYCYCCNNDSILWKSMSREDKMGKLTLEVMGSKRVCTLSGISKELATRLCNDGYTMARHLLGEFMVRELGFEVWFMRMVQRWPNVVVDAEDARLCYLDLVKYRQYCM